MIGLSILAALTLYGWVSFGVVWLVVKSAKKRGCSPVRWGILAGLVMYHLVFWDFIPTLVVYKYYCATKAGFWVYKTPEQWKAENPGVAETLTWREMSPDYKAPGVAFGYRLNERIIFFRKETENSFVPVTISEELIVDSQNNETLVRQVSVGSGDPGTEFTRFWTHFKAYTPRYKDLWKYVKAFKRLGEEVK